MSDLRIVVLEGDQTGQELLEQALRVISPDVIGLDLELQRFDLSLENRRRTQNAVCTEAAEAMAEAGFGTSGLLTRRIRSLGWPHLDRTG